MNINFTPDQVDELTAMIKASKIRMVEWIGDAKKKGCEKEAKHLTEMLEKRKLFEVYVLKSIKEVPEITTAPIVKAES